MSNSDNRELEFEFRLMHIVKTAAVSKTNSRRRNAVSTLSMERQLFLQHFSEAFVGQFQQYLDRARMVANADTTNGITGDKNVFIPLPGTKAEKTKKSGSSSILTLPNDIHSTVYPARTLTNNGYDAQKSEIEYSVIAATAAASASNNEQSVQAKAVKDAVLAMKALWSDIVIQNKADSSGTSVELEKGIFDKAVEEEIGSDVECNEEDDDNDDGAAQGVFNYSYLDYFKRLKLGQEKRVEQALSSYVSVSAGDSDDKTVPSERYNQCTHTAKHGKRQDIELSNEAKSEGTAVGKIIGGAKMPLALGLKKKLDASL